MIVYLYYVGTSIPMINDFNTFSSKIATIVRTNISNSEKVEIVPLRCRALNNDVDVKLVIAAKAPNANVQTIKTIQASVMNAIQFDQNAVKPFKVDVAIDESHTPPKSDATKSNPKPQGADKPAESDSELDYEKRAENYVAVVPEYTFDRVILPPRVLDKIQEALNIFKYENKVFKEWGLRTIEPHPSSSVDLTQRNIAAGQPIIRL